MLPELTQNVLDFLGNPASYAHHPTEVTLHQTHASWVFVASPYVYKIKKPVNFGFMDFTTLAQRKANCDREVALNRRLTEDIYLGVEAISLRDGKLQFGGAGDGESDVVEWVVKMRELDPRDFLSHRISEKRLELSDLDRVIERLVEFYRQQTPLDSAKAQAAVAQMPKNIANNYKIARRFIPDCTSKLTIDLIEHFTQSFETTHAELLASRPKSGMIRDCHGDLHLEHIHITPNEINIYDCIEFNTEFREIDIACDIAFLAMDLDFNHRLAESKRLVKQVAVELDDPALPSLVDYYKCYRACVRGKVEALTSAKEEIDELDQLISRTKSRRYFQLALRHALVGSKPIAVVMMGGVGTGKSTLAADLVKETGWLHINSDVIRKEMAGIPASTRGTPQQRSHLYSQEMTARTYSKLLETAINKLQDGDPVIIDATFSKAAARDEFRLHLEKKGYDILWIEAWAPRETRLSRLREREQLKDVVSDAREEDFLDRELFYEPPTELSPASFLRQSTDGEREKVLGAILTRISAQFAQRI